MSEAGEILVLTISDSCYKNNAEDKSGPILEQLVAQTFPNVKIKRKLVPDEIIEITEVLVTSCTHKEPTVLAIFTTGGTGFSPRDVTPEATKAVIQRECPQMALAMSLESFKKTPFAALSRAICGIRNRTLIVNFPGSSKAVRECFEAIQGVLPHALELINNDLGKVKQVHNEIQQVGHVCPHKTATGDIYDRNSPFPMIPVEEALEIVFNSLLISNNRQVLKEFKSPVDIPPFRASIKDGYAMKSSGFSGTKKVVGNISAGDEISAYELQEDECFKINTGAAVPLSADCVVQIEDTKLLKTKKDGTEDLVEILTDPKSDLDIRPIGCDLKKGSNLFSDIDMSNITINAILASVGKFNLMKKPKIGIVSTGSELLAPTDPEEPGKIYDSNTTMLEELISYFGFECRQKLVLTDDFRTVKDSFERLFNDVDFVVCSGGVSMGDKDYIKPVLNALDFKIEFGRLNMKPGKPMTFATNCDNGKYFFGLPGNPVSAFVCFHLFVLPALRLSFGWEKVKCPLATLDVVVQNDQIPLDPRPEYVRATVTSKGGKLYAKVTGNQMSSRLQSIVGADVLLHLPGKTKEKPCTVEGDVVKASILRYDFISSYE